uniref:Uncharacterized protein n=1 Tax=viral metagenome TaxID=1070528 RepID=A0A6C0AFX4_9ZZZZ
MLSYLEVTLKNETKLVNPKIHLPKNDEVYLPKIKKLNKKKHLPKNNKNIEEAYTCSKCFFGYDDSYGKCECY